MSELQFKKIDLVENQKSCLILTLWKVRLKTEQMKEGNELRNRRTRGQFRRQSISKIGDKDLRARMLYFFVIPTYPPERRKSLGFEKHEDP